MRRRPFGLLLLSFVAAVMLLSGCRGTDLFRQYEYEEETYLALDGSATVYVNASLASLVALRGLDLDPNPRTRFDAPRIRALYSGSGWSVGAVTSWRRGGRRFAHIRVDIDDIRHLPQSPPFSWSSYEIARAPDGVTFRQTVGSASNRCVADVTWKEGELVAFRLHAPSKILFHNTGTELFKRGNILVWEQTLADRLAGKPLDMQVRMEATSILSRTLWLFAASFLLAIAALAVAIWWVMRRSKPSLGG